MTRVINGEEPIVKDTHASIDFGLFSLLDRDHKYHLRIGDAHNSLRQYKFGLSFDDLKEFSENYRGPYRVYVSIAPLRRSA